MTIPAGVDSYRLVFPSSMTLGSVVPLFLRVGVVFLAMSITLSSWITRLPDIMIALNMSKTTTGIALLAAPIGSLMMVPLVGRLVDRYSPGRMAMVSLLGLCAVLTTVGLANHWTVLALILFFGGVFNGAVEVSANAAASRIEKAHDMRLMSRAHGFWSLGFMTAALIAGTLSEYGIGYGWHLFATGIVIGLSVIVIARGLPALVYEPTVHAEGDAQPHFVLPGKEIAGLCVMALGVTMAEGAIYDWAPLFLRENLNASPFWASACYASFSLSMAFGRLGGDWFRNHFTAPAIVRACALATAVGLVGVLLAPNIPVAFISLMVMGLGVSLVFPIAITAAAARGGKSASNNIAALSLAVMSMWLVLPPFLGFIGDHFGLLVGFALLVPFIFGTFFTSHEAKDATPENLRQR